MTLEGINPENLPTPQTYTHVVAATGRRLVFIAGQEPEDSQGNVVGLGDLAAQARQVFANLGRALAAAGACTDQVAKITIFVVRHRPEYLPVIENARVSLFGDPAISCMRKNGSPGIIRLVRVQGNSVAGNAGAIASYSFSIRRSRNNAW